MKAAADALIAAIAAYDDDPTAIRRVCNVTALRSALDVGGHVVPDLTETDESPEAAALEAAVRQVEALLGWNGPGAAAYVVTRLLEVFPQSVAMPAGGWVHDWQEVSA